MMDQVPFVHIVMHVRPVDGQGRPDDSQAYWVTGLAALNRTDDGYPDSPTHEIRWCLDRAEGQYFQISLREPS